MKTEYYKIALKISQGVTSGTGSLWPGRSLERFFLWYATTDIDLEKLTEQYVKNMTSDELTKVLEHILKATDREAQLKVFRALMKYQNIDGLDLEEALKQELDRENTKESPWTEPDQFGQPKGL